MQAIYSSTAQTLSIIPRNSTSICGIPPTRSDFLGRPPGFANSKLRSRKRSSKKHTTSSGSETPTPALRIVASLSSGQILVVVVAVAAAVAVSAVYLNYYSKRKKHLKKVSAWPAPERYEKQGESVIHDLCSQDSTVDALHVENVKEVEKSFGELRKIIRQKDDDDNDQFHSLESASVSANTHTVDSLDLFSSFHNEQNVKEVEKSTGELRKIIFQKDDNENDQFRSLDSALVNADTHTIDSLDLFSSLHNEQSVKEVEKSTGEPRKIIFQKDDNDNNQFHGLESASVNADTHTIDSLDLFSLLHNEQSVKEAETTTGEPGKIIFQKDDDDNDQFDSLESASVNADTHTVDSLDLFSSLHNEQNTSASFQMKLTESGAAQSFASMTEVSEFESERCKEGTETGCTRPAYQGEIGKSSSVSVSDIPGQENFLKKLNDHVDYEITTFSASSQESGKEELPLFYVEDQSVTTFPKLLHEIPELCSQGSYPGSHHISASARTSAAELLQEDHHFLASGCSEQNSSFLPYEISNSHKRKDLERVKGTETERTALLSYDDHHLALRQRRNVQGKESSSRKIVSYHRLLRYGRLKECIELLEEMDKEGALDMNKVYHSKFLSLCRSQKAVNEAFRFVKLISNPTLSTFNMLMSVCSSAQDSEGAAKVWQLVQEAGFKADCKLYTTMISTYGKSGKVDAMFKVFHEMVNSGVEPNLYTYGALIDGCARSGQVAKAFGAYGMLRSKKVKPDRVIFNALITACGQSGAVDRAFDVLEEMRAEPHPIDPDHVTIGALMKACTNAGQVDRVEEVYKMIQHYNIKGTAELYTIAVNSCSQTGDWTFACNIYSDMRRNSVEPDEMFLSALIDVAGHAGNVDAAFEVLQVAKLEGMNTGIMPYSSLMGTCCSNKNWRKALELYEEIKAMSLVPEVTTMNALITALCEGNQLQKALEVLLEMKKMGLSPNVITHSILFVASEKNDNLDVGLMLLSQTKADNVPLNLVMCKCLIGMCFRRFEKVATVDELSVSFKSGKPQIENEWTSLAVMIYREAIAAGLFPSVDILSQVLGCLQLPTDLSFKERLIELLGVDLEASRSANYFSLIDGFGEYDLRAFTLLEEAASLGIIPCVSFKGSPVAVDARNWPIHVAEVYLLAVLKGLKHRLAAGAKLPTVSVLLPVEVKKILSQKGEKTINVAGRVSQAIGALLRRIGLPYQGNESYGKIRVGGRAVKKWFQPKSVPPFSGKQTEFGMSAPKLGKQIAHQQRKIRTGNYSFLTAQSAYRLHKQGKAQK